MSQPIKLRSCASTGHGRAVSGEAIFVCLNHLTKLYAEAGTEIFIGCLDRNHDGDCRDRWGEMRTVFIYWASFRADQNGNRTRLIQG